MEEDVYLKEVNTIIQARIGHLGFKKIRKMTQSRANHFQ